MNDLEIRKTNSERKAAARADKFNQMRAAVASVSEEDKKMFDAVASAMNVLTHFVLSIIVGYTDMRLRIRRLEKANRELRAQTCLDAESKNE